MPCQNPNFQLLLGFYLENGYQLRPKRSSRYPAEFLTDTDFADDIALISQSLEHAQDLLQSLEQASNGVGLYLNETKTKCMNRCLLNNNNPVKTLNGTSLKQVEDYKYLGSISPHRIRISIPGRVWHGQHAMTCIKSGLQG